MRKLHLSAAAALFAVLLPAAAQSQTRYYGVSNVDTRLQRLEDRIDRQVQNGRISRSEAAMLDREIRTVRDLQRRYSRNGLSQWEMSDLQQRVANLQARFRDNRGGYRDGRYDDGRFDDDGRFYDDRDERWDDRDEQWDERYDGRDRDERYDYEDRSSYYAVPERYRYQFRDDQRSYFRYRDGFIYQFDRRTGRVLNTFSIGNR